MKFREVRNNLSPTQIDHLVRKIKQGEYRISSNGMVTVPHPKLGHPSIQFSVYGGRWVGHVRYEIPLPIGYVVKDRCGLTNTNQSSLADYHRELEEIMKC